MWDRKKMFENIDMKQILVTGPQRSGTRICAKMVAHDTGLPYIDEVDVLELFMGKSIDDRNQDWEAIGESIVKIVQEMVDTKEFVLHCPPFMPWIHKIKKALVIIMYRSVKDIVKSSDRIKWKKGRHELEYNKMGFSRFGKGRPRWNRTTIPIAELKYEYWEDVQKGEVRHFCEVEYFDLQQHPLWIPQEDRGRFKWNQTQLDG